MNEEAQLAWQIVETTDTSLFLTGRAGTGKTTFLRNLKERTSKCAVVVAPTGIAALNAGGVTMHSFFQLPFAPYVPGTKFGSQGSQVRMSREKKRVIKDSRCGDIIRKSEGNSRQVSSGIGSLEELREGIWLYRFCVDAENAAV